MSEVRLLSEGEVADLLRVKPCTVRNERVRGKLGFIRIGARIFYSPEQVETYVEDQKVAPRLMTEPAAPSMGSFRAKETPSIRKKLVKRRPEAPIDKGLISRVTARTFGSQRKPSEPNRSQSPVATAQKSTD